MAGSPTPLRLRPLPLADLLDETFKMYRGNFGLLLVLSIIAEIPATLQAFLSGSYLQVGQSIGIFQNLNNPAYLQRIQQSQQNPFSSIVGTLLGYAVLLITLPVAVLVIQATLHLAMGRPATVEGVFRDVLRRYWGIYGALFLTGLAAIACLCPPLGIWILVGFAVATPALLEERIGPIDALSRSWDLVRGNWWRVFGILIVTRLLIGVVTYALSLLFVIPAFLVPGLSDVVRGSILLLSTQALTAVVNPVFGIVVTLLYFDLRVRKEAIDLEQMAYTAAGPPPYQPGY
jgi:hypothetical protein